MFSAARWRLTIVFTAVLVVILVVSGAVVYATTRSTLMNRVDSDLEERVYRDQDFLTHQPFGRFADDMMGGGQGGPESRRFEPEGYFYALVDVGGEVLAGSPYLDTNGLAPLDALERALDDGDAFAETESSEGDAQRVYVVPVEILGGGAAFLQIGRSIESEEGALSQLRIVLLAVLGVAVVPSVVGGYLLSGRALRPIKAAVDSQRTFVADASHELRTPVAVVRTNAELLERHLASPRGVSQGDAVTVADILSESERLGKMVDQMLTLAQADAGQAALLSEEVALDEVAENVGRSMNALAVSRGVDLRTRIEGRVEVRGDRERLRELLVILVDNAIKYTEPGGRVELALRRKHRSGIIVVSDTGHGIPAESLPHIFDRFYRVDKARSRESGGTGLGLAIARQIVDTHGGTIGVQSELGKGTTVTVELKARSRDGQMDARPQPSESAEPLDG